MKVVVVFESMFGNTEVLGGDVTAGLAEAGAGVTMTDVSDSVVHQIVGCDLVVLAAPTHALALSRPESRADAAGTPDAEALAGRWQRECKTSLASLTATGLPPGDGDTIKQHLSG